MADISLSVQGLGKKYLVPHSNVDHGRGLISKVRSKTGVGKMTYEEFWAARDLTFEVHAGEVVGLVGRNGAGKSTTLKLLSRITEPTEGSAKIYGRLGSLLEVGTGFHPELTGQENIYLNGAILGMSRKQINSHLDEIIDFAGVSKFLDMPVKRYSSGMYVRLAFAVAANLDTDILIVDEVLAVGDAEFQNKCLGKMEDVANKGRTVLLVSHNMFAVRKFCTRCIWLDGGRIVKDGPTESVVDAYMVPATDKGHGGVVDLRDWAYRYGDGGATFVGARLLDGAGRPVTRIHRDSEMVVEFTFDSKTDHALHFTVQVVSTTGAKVLHSSHHDSLGPTCKRFEGKNVVTVRFEHAPLAVGDYYLDLGIHTAAMGPLDVCKEILPFQVDDMIDSPRPYVTQSIHGLAWIPSKWEISSL